MAKDTQESLLAELAKIHEEWREEVDDVVEANFDHSDPHDKFTMESDYILHHSDRSASAEQERIFQERVADVLDRLGKL